MDRGKQIIKRFDGLKSARQQLEYLWEDAFDYTFPLRGTGFSNDNSGDAVSNASDARSKKAVMFDSTAADSSRLLAASMISGLTPPNSQWFNLVVPPLPYGEELDYEARIWLEKAAKKLHTMIHNSNYDSEGFEFFLDIIVGGMAGLFCELDEDTDEFIFEMWSLDDMYCAEMLNKQRIDTVYRILRYTPGQAVEKFGLDNLPEEIQNKFDQNPHDATTYEFIHCIQPRLKNGKQITGGKRSKALPFESTYVCRKSGHIVKESGFHEFPVMVPRWSRIPKSVYAVGPVDTALPDIKTLNKVRQIVLTNGELQISGMYAAKEDGILNTKAIKIGPRQVIPMADTNNLKPLNTGGDVNFAQYLTHDLQANIRKVLLSDQLQPQDANPTMTATEINVRVQLIRRLLGPVYGRFSSEFLTGLIHRTFWLVYRAGLFGEAPESLTKYGFEPMYQSPLARAQKSEDADHMQQFEGSLASMSQAYPEVLDLYDADKAARYKAELLGVPIETIRTDRDVKKLRKDRQEQAQQAQLAQMAGQQ